MKKVLSFGIAVLMILATCLFVSCNSEVSTTAQVNDGKLVYATFDKMSKAIRPSSSSMTISYELDNIDDLYWVYTATKTDGAGTTGQTDGTRVPGDTTTHKGLGGAIGPFSKGTWTFTVEGYKYTGASTEIMDPSVETLRESTDFNLIYVGTADGVVLNVTNTSDNPEPINITVYLQTQGGTGTLKIAANSKFFWAATGEGGYALEDLKLKVYDGETLKDKIDLTGYASEGEGHAVYYSNANDTSINGLASGDHVFKVQVVRTVGEVDQVFFEGTVNAKIYAGITTALDTQAIEGLFTYAQFNGTIDDSAVVVVATDTATTTSAGNVEFATNYTPASGINPSTDKKTTVSISGDESTISVDATYDLGVETSNIIAAGSKFSVASDSTPVASIDLTLTKTVGETTTTISTFGDNGAATVTTYIAKNLTDVHVHYNGDGAAPTNMVYEPATGKLSFVTTHFSEFYVTSADKVYDNQTNSCYTLEAFNSLDVTTIADHEFLLLDAAVANDVDDSRDVFNAGFKWAVIHTPSDLPNTTDFAGGYGTKIEPYMIASTANMKKISDYYATYKYYKVSSEITAMDCTGWVPLKLHGSFDGNEIAFNNVTACLFQNVGYQLENEKVVLKNINATMNVSSNGEYGAAALIKNIFNSGKTTFNNVNVHGYLEGYWNMGSFYNYGTANYNNVGSNYEVEFNNCTSDATLVCASGNVIGGLFGHSYEGKGHSFTLRVNNSNYTGHMYLTTTSGKGNKYYGMTSDYYNANNHFYFNGVEDTFNNGDSKNSGAYTNSTKITKVVATKGSDAYKVAKQDGVAKIVATVTAQLTAYDSDDVQIPNLSGITMVLSNNTIMNPESSQDVLGLFSTVSISHNQETYDASIVDSELQVKLATDSNYLSGNIRLQINQYDANNAIVSAGTIDIATCEDATSSWVVK